MGREPGGLFLRAQHCPSRMRVPPARGLLDVEFDSRHAALVFAGRAEASSAWPPASRAAQTDQHVALRNAVAVSLPEGALKRFARPKRFEQLLLPFYLVDDNEAGER